VREVEVKREGVQKKKKRDAYIFEVYMERWYLFSQLSDIGPTSYVCSKTS
jgi:hypothetical protein